MSNRRNFLSLAISAWFASLFGRAEADTLPDDIGQFREIVIKAARQKFPSIENIKRDTADPAKFTIKLGDDVTTLDVTNVFNLLKANPDVNQSDKIARLISLISPLRSFTEDKIIPAIRTRDYVEYSELRTGEAFYEPLIGELHVIYMLDQQDFIKTVTKSETNGKSSGELRQIAMANISKWLPLVKVDETLSPIYQYMVEGNEILSPSLILVDEFWEQAKPKVSDDVYFAIPRRDQLFLLSAQNADALPALRKLVELTFEDNFNLLSEEIFRRRGGKIETVSN